MIVAAESAIASIQILEYVRADAPISPRIASLKTRLLENLRQIDSERARFTTEAYQATEGEPMPIRRAKMLQHLARFQSIAIGDDELIVGNR